MPTLTDSTKIPFGKHKGFTFKQVKERDFSYAKWLEKNWKEDYSDNKPKPNAFKQTHKVEQDITRWYYLPEFTNLEPIKDRNTKDLVTYRPLFLSSKKDLAIHVLRIKYQLQTSGVYLIDDGRHYKIGFSRDIISRFRSIRGSNINSKLIGFIRTMNYVELEKQLHTHFAKYNSEYEWFTRTKTILSYFKSHKDFVANNQETNLIFEKTRVETHSIEYKDSWTAQQLIRLNFPNGLPILTEEPSLERAGYSHVNKFSEKMINQES
jgi:hypothetical protein